MAEQFVKFEPGKTFRIIGNPLIRPVMKGVFPFKVEPCRICKQCMRKSAPNNANEQDAQTTNQENS